MARRLVCEEEGEPINNTVITQGALNWPEDRVPVVYGVDRDGFAIGWATDFRREGTNVTAEIKLHSDKHKKIEAKSTYAITVKPFSERLRPHEPREIIDARIVEVHLLPPLEGMFPNGSLNAS